MQSTRIYQLTLAVICGAVLLAPLSAWACIHSMRGNSLPPTYRLKMIAAWEGGVQDLIVGFDLPKGPPLAYVLPVPNIPSKYGTQEEKVFSDLRRELRPPKRTPYLEKTIEIVAGDPRSTEPALKVHEVKEVGPFKIQPLEARGEAGLMKLQEWMTSNGFAPIESDLARYYVERKWAFLAVKLDPNAKRIPALHVRFDAGRIILPLKMLAPSGDSDLSLEAFVLAGSHFGRRTVDGLAARGFSVSSADRHRGDGQRTLTVHELVPGRVSKSTHELVQQLHIKKRQRIAASYVHTDSLKEANPSAWFEELSLPFLDEDQKLLGGDEMPYMPVGSMDPPVPDPGLGDWSDPLPGKSQLDAGASPEIEVVTGDSSTPSAAAESCSGCSQGRGTLHAIWLLIFATLLGARRRHSP